MTISYNLDVSSSNSWTFLRVIFRWKGSIWKSVINEFIWWTISYFLISFIYRNLMTKEQQLLFGSFSQYLNERMDYIPLTFLLGFFVTIVVDRWKNIFANIGFVDNAAFYVANYIHGDDEETKITRRNIIRYLCLTQVLVLRDISIKVRKRFPSIYSVIEAGFLQEHEWEMMKKFDDDFSKYWIPINWIFALCVKLRQNGKIAADVLLNGILTEVRIFHINLRTLCNYDWVPVPLAYPQVVFLAVRSYFTLCLISRQYIINNELPNYNRIDLYIPFMSMMQLIFYMGWLKVAEALLNPLGEDDDDFESNFIIDRNITIAMAMIEQSSSKDIPEQMRDKFHKGEKPLYSEETATMPIHPLIGSAARLTVDEPIEKTKMIPRTSSDFGVPLNKPERSNSAVYHNNFNSFSNRIKRGIQRRRSNSVTVQSVETGRSNSVSELPPTFYENAQFYLADFSASTPARTLDTVNEEDNTNTDNDTQSNKSK